ncbi:MAG: hypothetical protein R3B68_12950 [Phycisphaerales bacterium]
MKLIHRDQPVVERLRTEPLEREAERGVGADQNRVARRQELPDGLDLAAVVAAGASVQVPTGSTFQSVQKPCLLSGSSWKLEPMVFPAP